jgi:hypothetical protein
MLLLLLARLPLQALSDAAAQKLYQCASEAVVYSMLHLSVVPDCCSVAALLSCNTPSQAQHDVLETMCHVCWFILTLTWLTRLGNCEAAHMPATNHHLKAAMLLAELGLRIE